MKSKSSHIALPLAVSVAALAHEAAAQQDVQLRAPVPAVYATDRIFVKPRAHADLAAAHAALRTEVRRKWDRFGGLQVVELRGGISVEDAVAEFQKLEEVEYAEPLYYLQTFETPTLEPNDPKFGDGTLWNLKNSSPTTADISAPRLGCTATLPRKLLWR
jgi:hypothetical protein